MSALVTGDFQLSSAASAQLLFAQVPVMVLPAGRPQLGNQGEETWRNAPTG